MIMLFNEKLSESEIISKSIADKIKKKFKNKNLNLHEPLFLGDEYKFLKECIDTKFVSSIGGFVRKFERISN